MKSAIMGFVILLVVSITTPGLVLAQDQDIQTVQSTQTTGEILKKENSTLTVESENQVQELRVPDNVQITKNGTQASLDDLQTGDDVVITHTESGEVLGVEAISGEILDWGMWIVPGILGLIILGALFYILKRRMNKGYIQTSTDTR